MSKIYRESVLNSRILANYFKEVCEKFSPPYKDENDWMNCRKAESNVKILQFLNQTGRLIKDGKVDGEVFKNDVKNIKKFGILRVEILWYLEVSKIMTLAEYIDYHECNNNEEIIGHISQQIYEHFISLSSHDSKLRREMLIDYIKMFGYNVKVRKTSLYQKVLSLVTSNLKEFYKCEENYDDNLNLLQLAEVFNASELNCEVIKSFFIQILNSLLEGIPQTIRSTFKKQEKLKNNFKDRKILQFYDVISKWCEHNELIAALEAVLLDTSKGIDWDNMFCFVRFLGVSIKDGWSYLRKVCNSIIIISLKNSNERLLSYAFLIARQGCFEKSNCFFPSYLQWFSSTFSTESKRPINSKQTSTFFFNFLSDLVPFDPIYYSKVHINRVPCVPIDCQYILNEYVTLVKTHLTDLNASVELGICENPTEKSAAVYDVENVLKHFERTKDILNSVFQASMFCKDYYEKKFLVELLSKFEGKKSTRHILILKLHTLGKIPNSLFKTYKALEKKK